MTLAEYKDCLAKLSVNKKGTFVAPHKAVLLLAVFEMIGTGEIDTPFIPLTNSLVKRFELIWKRYVSNHKHFNCSFNYPFQHLESSPFWTLVKLPTYQFSKEYSLTALKRNFAGAMMDEDLFELVKDDTSRTILETTLINTYLS